MYQKTRVQIRIGQGKQIFRIRHYQPSFLFYLACHPFFAGLEHINKSAQHTAHYRQQDYVRQFMSLLSLHFREQRRDLLFRADAHHSQVPGHHRHTANGTNGIRLD